jgi:uncharacterized delta-60 repeat protein
VDWEEIVMNAFLMRFVSILAGFGLSVGAHAAVCTAGQFDAAFGPAATGGYVQVSPWISGGNPFEGLIFGGDSKLYVVTAVAQDRTANYWYAGLIRSAKGGAIDRSYGGFGFVAPGGQALPTESVGSNANVTQDMNGNVIVAVFNSTGIAVSRFLSDGMLDGSFGDSGVAQVNLSNVWEIIGLRTAADGSVLIATTAQNPSAPNAQQPVVIKLTPTGALDPSFGAGGLAFPFPTGYAASSFGRGTDLAVLASGQIVVTGRLAVLKPTPGTGRYFQMFVARLLADGSLDTSFGSGGFTILDFGPAQSAIGRKLAIQPDGKIISVGMMSPSDGSNPTSASAFRFNSNGSIDPSFGSGGVSQILSGYSYFAVSLALQNNGKILVSTQGFTDATATVLYSAIARLTTTGQLDPVFGNNGVTTLAPAGPTANSPSIGMSTIAMAGNRIIVSASASNGSSANALGAAFLAAIDTGAGPNCH